MQRRGRTIGRGMALFAILSALILASPAVATKRVALAIGNDKYDTLPQLNNAGTDARGVADKLRGLGFDVRPPRRARLHHLYPTN